jgi:hypothetical protein
MAYTIDYNSWEERNIDVSRATKIKLSISFLVSELSPGDAATSITTQHRHLHQAILPVDRSRALSHLSTARPSLPSSAAG